MVVARARLFDVGANEETALGDVADSGLDARQDLGPFRRRAAELQHPDLIILPAIGIDYFDVAEGLDRLGPHRERHIDRIARHSPTWRQATTDEGHVGKEGFRPNK